MFSGKLIVRSIIIMSSLSGITTTSSTDGVPDNKLCKSSTKATNSSRNLVNMSVMVNVFLLFGDTVLRSLSQKELRLYSLWLTMYRISSVPLLTCVIPDNRNSLSWKCRTNATALTKQARPQFQPSTCFRIAGPSKSKRGKLIVPLVSQ